MQTSNISFKPFNPVRHYNCLHPMDGEAEVHNSYSYLMCQGHSQDATEADLGCVTKYSWVAPGVMLRFMEARSGNFTGLFHPSSSPTAAPNTNTHTYTHTHRAPVTEPHT